MNKEGGGRRASRRGRPLPPRSPGRSALAEGHGRVGANTLDRLESPHPALRATFAGERGSDFLCNAPLVKSSCGGRLLDGHFEAELLEPLDAAQCNRLAALRVQVRGAEVLEVGAVLEHPVDGKQNRVGNCDGSTFAAPASGQAVVAGREEGRLATPRTN